VVFGLLLALGITGGGAWYLAHRGIERTDDAQVDTDVVSVPSRAAGVVVKVLFDDNQAVKEGDVLAELDDAPARARLAQAEAALASAQATADAADADASVSAVNARGNKSVAEASLQTAAAGATSSREQIAEGEAALHTAQVAVSQATVERDRSRALFEQGAVARAQLDQAMTAFDAATAQLEQARARVATLRSSVVQARSRIHEASARVQQASDIELLIQQAAARARAAHAQVSTAKALRDLAALELSYTRILAPQAGVVSKRTVAVGQMVSAGQPVVQLVPSQTPWVTGNFKETQLGRMRAGQPAVIEIDAFPGLELHGEVESLSAATGARFALLPPDNASGNFTKVVQRVPVRVRLTGAPAGVTLRPGMSAELSIDTRR
jgi:membrane fusion protein, multidrug efflux system